MVKSATPPYVTLVVVKSAGEEVSHADTVYASHPFNTHFPPMLDVYI
jgi:hypothetical protein